MAKPMFESDPWNQKESSSSQIKYEDEDNSGSVFHSDFNPDDLERSTSAPPVLELASESLFAFNTDGFEPAEYYRLFGTDVRCDENYERFYQSYRQDNGHSNLPPPMDQSPLLLISPMEQLRVSKSEQHMNNQYQNGQFGGQQHSMAALNSNVHIPKSQSTSILQPGGNSFLNSANTYIPAPQHHMASPMPMGGPMQRQPGMSTSPLPNGIPDQGVFFDPNTSHTMAQGMVFQYSPMTHMPTSPKRPTPQMPSMQMPQMPQMQQMMTQQVHPPPGLMPMPRNAHHLPSGAVSPRGSMLVPPQVAAPQPTSASANKLQVNGTKPIPIKIKKKNNNQEIWTPLAGNKQSNQDLSKIRNKNLGKVAINSESNLSSSTDDLLSLAGKTHQLSFLVSPKEEEPIYSEEDQLNRVNGRVSPRGVQSQRVQSTVAGQTQSKISITTVAPSSNSIPVPVLNMQQLNGVSTSPTGMVNMIMPTTPGGTLQKIIPTQAPPNTTQICRYYTQGFCSRGERCNFLHVDQVSDPSTIASKQQQPAQQQQIQQRPAPAPRVPITSPSRYTNMTLKECVGNIYGMCKDQHGCRFLQKRLDEDDAAATQIIFTEVVEHIVDLMSDPFGNYLCQKLIEHCTTDQRIAIVKGVSKDLVSISKNMHGTRAVQKMIELLDSAEEVRVVRESLKGSVVELIQDLNGNHVIQKSLQKMEPNDNQFIYDAVARHCVQVATHRHGCCVMQRCIDHATLQQKLQLMNEITRNSLSLVQDAFGNYVVQYILDLNLEDICEKLVVNLLGQLFYLATQKFSSNVIEKCFKVGNARTIQYMAKELVSVTVMPAHLAKSANGMPEPLVALLQDPYGNYVVQTCLSESATKAPKEYVQLAARIRPHLPALRNTAYLKRIQALLNLHNPAANGSSMLNQ
jgi:hypothetical protein